MRFAFIVVVSLVIATALSLRWQAAGRTDFGDVVLHAALAEEVRADGSKCPLSGEAVERVQAWVLAACVGAGLNWYLAAEAYGADAEKVFLVYGQDPAFTEVFERLGPPVVPVVSYFVRNGSTQYRLQEALGQGWAQLWGDHSGPALLDDLSPEQYGLIAVEELRGRGHEMLSEFEIVDGVAVRKQFTRGLFAVKNVMFGGMSDLEKVIARGERLPTWSEVGWATVDVALVAGGIGMAAKSLRLAKAPAVAGQSVSRLQALRGAGGSAIRSLATVGKAAGVATVVAIPYLAVTRPEVLTGAAAWVAEQAGLPGWLGVFIACFAACLLVGTVLRMVLRPVVWAVRGLMRLGSLIFGFTSPQGSAS